MIPPIPPDRPPPQPDRDATLRARAQEMEALFLAEMLGHAGLGATSGDFGGGVGEEQFASFLRAEQARAITAKGGIGLAESLFKALAAGGRDAG